MGSSEAAELSGSQQKTSNKTDANNWQIIQLPHTKEARRSISQV